MTRACAVALAALAALVLGGVSPAHAQDPPVTTFVPEAARRWDAAWFVGWRGVNKADVAPEWNEWIDVAAFSASTSRHLTPHLKIEVDVSTTSVGRVVDEQFVGPPSPLPFYQLQQHRFRRTTVGAMLAYQFFENRWVHPFLGVGVEGVRETERLELLQFVPLRGTPAPPVLPTSRVVYGARPFVSGGIKFYVSERGFIRTDVLSAFSSGGAESAVWRIGAGVDF